jgi:signal transduction histidine kinase
LRATAYATTSTLEEVMKDFFKKLTGFLDKYSILVAAGVIYGYYLITSVDLLKKGGTHTSFLDYLLQFDSLILLWIIAAVLIQLQRYRKQQREERDYRRKIQLEFEKQRIHLQLLDEITTLLQDNVNNPLAQISITSHNIRKRFPADEEIMSYLDKIDSSLQRIHATINDIKAFQSQNLVEPPEKASVN